MSVPDAVVAAVAEACGDLSADQVKRVFAALDAVKEGAPVGTVAVDPKSGACACRVSDGGVPCWVVVSADGGTHKDMQPTLSGWNVVHEPVESLKKKGQ